MSENGKNEKNLVIAFAIFVILAGVFVAISEAVKIIDTANVPAWLLPAVTIVTAFFGKAPVAFGIAWLRNMLGFFRNWLKARVTKESPVNYDLNRFYDTMLYYIGPFTVALAAIPEPYNFLGAAAIFVIDVFLSEWKKVQA